MITILDTHCLSTVIGMLDAVRFTKYCLHGALGDMLVYEMPIATQVYCWIVRTAVSTAADRHYFAYCMCTSTRLQLL